MAKGNRITNAIGGRAGKGVPHLFNSKLLQYGFSVEQQIAYRKAGFKWCGYHKKFEPASDFHRSCKQCRTGARLKAFEVYKKNGSAKKRHHLPHGWYEKKLEEQNFTCALCPATFGNKNNFRLFIDHSHKCCDFGASRSCGKCARGLLCILCNHRIGNLEIVIGESQPITPLPGTWTEKALAYIQSYEKEPEFAVIETGIFCSDKRDAG